MPKRLILVAMILALSALNASAAPTDTQWQPRASERLIRLPAEYLQKAIDRDFANSRLAQALKDVDSDVNFKERTLEDISGALAQAEGETRTDLNHQLLVEKREYIQRMGERLDLQRQHLETRKAFYQRLLKKMARQRQPPDPQQKALRAQQASARARLERTATDVDLKFFASPRHEESRYAREYRKNLDAIQQLVAAIEQHPMNARPTADADSLSRPQMLRRLIADADAQLEILNQEDRLIGHMAKLVALDALALSEDLKDAEQVDSGMPPAGDVASAVNFFLD